MPSVYQTTHHQHKEGWTIAQPSVDSPEAFHELPTTTSAATTLQRASETTVMLKSVVPRDAFGSWGGRTRHSKRKGRYIIPEGTNHGLDKCCVITLSVDSEGSRNNGGRHCPQEPTQTPAQPFNSNSHGNSNYTGNVAAGMASATQDSERPSLCTG